MWWRSELGTSPRAWIAQQVITDECSSPSSIVSHARSRPAAGLTLGDMASRTDASSIEGTACSDTLSGFTHASTGFLQGRAASPHLGIGERRQPRAYAPGWAQLPRGSDSWTTNVQWRAPSVYASARPTTRPRARPGSRLYSSSRLGALPRSAAGLHRCVDAPHPCRGKSALSPVFTAPMLWFFYPPDALPHISTLWVSFVWALIHNLPVVPRIPALGS